MQMISLFLFIIVLPTALAFISSVSTPTGPPPLFDPVFIITEQTPATSSHTMSIKCKYDLGLGKNPPVTKSRRVTPWSPSCTLSSSRTTNEAARFWMVPENVNTYPSPPAQDVPEQEQQPVKMKKVLPKVKPLRTVPDELLGISGHSKYATATLNANRVDLDVNTLWVEMLIHHQQHQHMDAAAIAV